MLSNALSCCAPTSVYSLHITSIYINKPPADTELTPSCRLFFVATRFPAFPVARLSQHARYETLVCSSGREQAGGQARGSGGSSSICRQFRLLTGVWFLVAPAHFVTLLPPFKRDCFECWVKNKKNHSETSGCRRCYFGVKWQKKAELATLMALFMQKAFWWGSILRRTSR